MFYRAGVALLVPVFLAAQEAAVLQIRVLEGEGAIHAPGSRSGRPLAVQVADETGRPVGGAAVSFRLPDEGPGGVFASGMRTEVVLTGADGRAAVWGIQWNRTAGPFQIRVTTVKGQSRAGAVIPQYLSDAVSQESGGDAPPASMRPARGRWFYAVLVMTAGAAAGGAAMGLSRYSKTTAQPAVAGAVTLPATQVGAPIISVGKP